MESSNILNLKNNAPLLPSLDIFELYVFGYLYFARPRYNIHNVHK